MTETVLIKIACVIAAVVGYGLLRWRLMVATHGFRVRVGCEADRWASDPRVSDEVRVSLASLADAFYRPAAPWIVVTILAVAIFLPVGAPRTVELSKDRDVAMQLVALKLKLTFALVTTSPLACVVAVVVLVSGLLIHSSVSAVIDIVSAAGRTSLRTPPSAFRHS